MSQTRVGVVGAGIVGLALARELQNRDPTCAVTVLDKEAEPGRHQTSHNSGVVHAGLYYKPGSLKAELCARGRRLMEDYCAEHAIPHAQPGKLVVAVTDDEVDGLREIHRRALSNGVPDIAWLEPAQMREIEPHVQALAAVHSPHTGIADFAAVARCLAKEVEAQGGQLCWHSRVTAIARRAPVIEVRTSADAVHVFDRLVLCGGLQSDRLGELAGGSRDPAIIPFLGMYYALIPERQHLVQSLVYPVPDARYPFLGVHLTRTIDESVIVGPNAVLGMAREGYRPLALDHRDLVDTLRWPGLRRLARQHWRQGVREVIGASSRHLFAAAARRYVPELRDRDLKRAWTGVRAQAVWADGSLADDFVVQEHDGVMSVRNAPSPAATSALAIAEHLAPQVLSR